MHAGYGYESRYKALMARFIANNYDYFKVLMNLKNLLYRCFLGISLLNIAIESKFQVPPLSTFLKNQ